MDGVTDDKEQPTYTRAEVDAAVAEALRRVRRELEHWEWYGAVPHVEHVADALGVQIPDE
jgi:hypothetical protein